MDTDKDAYSLIERKVCTQTFKLMEKHKDRQSNRQTGE